MKHEARVSGNGTVEPLPPPLPRSSSEDYLKLFRWRQFSVVSCIRKSLSFAKNTSTIKIPSKFEASNVAVKCVVLDDDDVDVEVTIFFLTFGLFSSSVLAKIITMTK